MVERREADAAEVEGEIAALGDGEGAELLDTDYDDYCERLSGIDFDALEAIQVGDVVDIDLDAREFDLAALVEEAVELIAPRLAWSASAMSAGPARGRVTVPGASDPRSRQEQA